MLKKFHQFISEQASTQTLSPAQESFLNKYTEGSWSINPQTGLVDVNGDFSCWGDGITDFRGIRFGRVSGNFDCSHNDFTSLEGAPEFVGKDFFCGKNKPLTSLKYSPKFIGKDFNCYDSKLASLEGAPENVGGDFNCSWNKLVSLEGAPKIKKQKKFLFNNNLFPDDVLKASLKSPKEYSKALLKALKENRINITMLTPLIPYIDLEWIDV